MVAEVLEHGMGEHVRAPEIAALRAGAGEEEQLAGVADGEKAEQDLVGDGEDGGVGADAEGQGEQGDGGEEGGAFEIAEGVAKVLQHACLMVTNNYLTRRLIGLRHEQYCSRYNPWYKLS